MLGRTNTGGGGGGGLNFKVICNPQPSTAKENTIWVDTDRINNTHFSATQPENMADYDVWISTGTSSTVAFSATKKNPIMVYPTSAKQYIGGALVDKTAMSYKGGKWVEWWNGQLFSYGKHYEEITGGWKTTWTFTKQADGSYFYTRKSGADFTPLQTVNKIDLSKWKTLCMSYHGHSSVSGNEVVMYLESKDYTTGVIPSGASGVARLDISTVNTAERIIVNASDTKNTIYIEEIWLED